MRLIVLTIVIWGALLCGGCTLNFKAKEIELEGIPVISYELESMDLFKPVNAQGLTNQLLTKGPDHVN